MAIEASFTTEQSGFPLSAVFEQLPDARIELDQVFPTQDAVVPYFCIYATGAENLRTDLSADVGVNNIQVIDEVEDQMLVRIDWNLDYESVLTASLRPM